MKSQKVENTKIHTMLKNWGIQMWDLYLELPAQLSHLYSFGAVNYSAVVMLFLQSSANTVQQLFFNALDLKFVPLVKFRLQMYII